MKFIKKGKRFFTKSNTIESLEQTLLEKEKLLSEVDNKKEFLTNVNTFSNFAAGMIDEMLGINFCRSYANRAIHMYKKPMQNQAFELNKEIRDIKNQINKIKNERNSSTRNFINYYKQHYKQKKNINFNLNSDLTNLQAGFGYAKTNGVLIDIFVFNKKETKIQNSINATSDSNLTSIAMATENKNINTIEENKNIDNIQEKITLVFAVNYGEVDDIIGIEINGKLITYEGQYLQTNNKNNQFNQDNTNLDSENTFNNIKISIHNGSEDQEVDLHLQEHYGINNCPAYKGIAYVVMQNLTLHDYYKIKNVQFHILKTNNYLSEYKISSRHQIESIVLIPGCGEFVYDTIIRTKQQNENIIPLNSHNPHGIANVLVSLNHLKVTCPNLKNISLVICWFARGKFENNQVDVASIVSSDIESNVGIFPCVEYDDDIKHSTEWSVANFRRNPKNNNEIKANVITKVNNTLLFGGTPSDESLINLVTELKMRGFNILINPMLMIDLHEKPWRGMITYTNEADIVRFFRGKNQNFAKGYNNFILHYAKLLGPYVDEFSLGSEFYGLSKSIVFALEMKILAKEVRSFLQKNCKILYGSNYDEYHQKDNNRIINLLHTSPYIDIVGIHAYPPITDVNNFDIITPKMCEQGWQTGEGWDWSIKNNIKIFYTNKDERWKDFAYWQRSSHHIENIEEKIANLSSMESMLGFDYLAQIKTYLAENNIEEKNLGKWAPDMKKVWLDEIGCASINNSTNQPNIFIDPNSINGVVLPKNSNCNIDLSIQDTFIKGSYNYWKNKQDSVERLYWWCWEARPFPAWPKFNNIWSDGDLWSAGHYLNGKIPLFSVRELIIAIFENKANQCNYKIKSIKYDNSCIVVIFIENKMQNIVCQNKKDLFIKKLVIYGLDEIVHGFILNFNNTISQVLSQLMIFVFFDIKIQKDEIFIIEKKEQINYLISQNSLKLSHSALFWLKEKGLDDVNNLDFFKNNINSLVNKYLKDELKVYQIDTIEKLSNQDQIETNNKKQEKEAQIEITEETQIEITQEFNSKYQIENAENSNNKDQINAIDQISEEDKINVNNLNQTLAPVKNKIDNAILPIQKLENIIQTNVNIISTKHIKEGTLFFNYVNLSASEIKIYITYFDLHLGQRNIKKAFSEHKNESEHFILNLITEEHKVDLICKKLMQNSLIESVVYDMIVDFTYISLKQSDLVILIINNKPIIAKILSISINLEDIYLKLVTEDIVSHNLAILNTNKYSYNPLHILELKEYRSSQQLNQNHKIKQNKIEIAKNIELITLQKYDNMNLSSYAEVFIFNEQTNTHKNIFIFMIISYEYEDQNDSNAISEESTSKESENYNSQENVEENNHILNVENLDNIENNITNNLIETIQVKLKNILNKNYNGIKIKLQNIINNQNNILDNGFFSDSEAYFAIDSKLDDSPANLNDDNILEDKAIDDLDLDDILNDKFLDNFDLDNKLINRPLNDLNNKVDHANNIKNSQNNQSLKIKNLKVKNQFSIILDQNIHGKVISIINAFNKKKHRYFPDKKSEITIETNTKIEYNPNENIILEQNLIKVGREFLLYGSIIAVKEDFNNQIFVYKFSNFIRGVHNTLKYSDLLNKEDQFIYMQTVTNSIKHENKSENLAILYFDAKNLDQYINHQKKDVAIDEISVFPINVLTHNVKLELFNILIFNKQNYVNNLKLNQNKITSDEDQYFYIQNINHDKISIFWNALHIEGQLSSYINTSILFEVQFILKKFKAKKLDIIYEKLHQKEWMNSNEIKIKTIDINDEDNAIEIYFYSLSFYKFEFLCSDISAIEKIIIIYKNQKDISENNKISKNAILEIPINI